MRAVLSTLVVAALASGAPVLAQTAPDFHWNGAIERGHAVEIKNVNGPIVAELATGRDVEVTATKRATRSDPANVHVEMVQEDGNVTFCAVYPDSTRTGRRDSQANVCRPGPAVRMNVDNNDTVVEFHVKIPAGVRFEAKTVNGAIDARGLNSEATVHTVNGKVQLGTSQAGSAHSVNGSIEATIGSAGTGNLEFKTVNGSITLRVPKNLNAQLNARMVNGEFQSELPLMVNSWGRHDKKIEGTLGSGGRLLDMNTVNGSIKLQLVTGN